MLSVIHPPFLFNSSWYTRSLSRSSRVPFLSFSEYRRSLSCRSAYVLFLFSSLSRISALFLSNSFCWCINNSRSREYPSWILPPFIQALFWPRGSWINERWLTFSSARRSMSSISRRSVVVNCKAKDISIKFAYSDYLHGWKLIDLFTHRFYFIVLLTEFRSWMQI